MGYFLDVFFGANCFRFFRSLCARIECLVKKEEKETSAEKKKSMTYGPIISGIVGIIIGVIIVLIPFIFQLLRQNREIRKRHAISMAKLEATQEWLRNPK